MTSSHPLRALARTWWLVVVVLVAAVATAAILTARQQPVYRSRAAVVIVPNSKAVESVRDFIDSLSNLDRRNVVATLARVLHSGDIVDRAAATITVPGFDRHAYVVRSIVLPNTNIIEVEVDGPSPDGCAALAGAITTTASSETAELYWIYRLKVLDEAVPSNRPVSPDAQRNFVVACILGLSQSRAPA
jgi:capsular polysaccharide biosynthesis protein